MSNKPPAKPKTLAELQSKWYKRLQKDGFKDIEKPDGSLKMDAHYNVMYNYRNQTVYDAKERYYQLASQFLHDHKFSSRLEKIIWEHHTHGIGIVNIVKEAKRKGLQTYKREVHETLQRLTKEMLKGRKRDILDDWE